MSMLVFVYGTLRKNAVNSADDFVGAQYIAADSIPGDLYDLGWYPGYKPGDGTNLVQGDIFEVNKKQLLRLDAYEGAPDLYYRSRVETYGGREAFVYVYNGAVNEKTRLPGGDWLELQEERETNDCCL